MPAHIYVRLGRYPDAVRVNEEAIAAQARQKAALDAQGFSQSFDWDGHNRDFLWFAALTEGRGELALAQARALAVRAAKGKSPTAEFMRGLPLLTLVRLERWGEVLDEPVPAGEAGLAAPMADYARGVALVRTGKLDAARERSAALQTALAQAGAQGRDGDGRRPRREGARDPLQPSRRRDRGGRGSGRCLAGGARARHRARSGARSAPSRRCWPRRRGSRSAA